MIIELIYDLDCPNVAKARANLAADAAWKRRAAKDLGDRKRKV